MAHGHCFAVISGLTQDGQRPHAARPARHRRPEGRRRLAVLTMTDARTSDFSADGTTFDGGCFSEKAAGASPSRTPSPA